MHMKFIPLGIVACLFVSAASARSLYAEGTADLVARCGGGCGDDWGNDGDNHDHSGDDNDHDGGHSGDDNDHDGGHNGEGHHGGHSSDHGDSLIAANGNSVILDNILTNIGNGATVTDIANDAHASVLSDGGRDGGRGDHHEGGRDHGHDGEGHSGDDDGEHSGDNSGDNSGEDGNGSDHDPCSDFAKRGLIGANDNYVGLDNVATNILNCLFVSDVANDAAVDVL